MSRAATCATSLLAIALVCITAVGQTQHESKADVFASVHQALNDAADRSLAAALAQQPWMKIPDKMPGNKPYSEMTPVTRLQVAVERVNRLRPIIEPILRQEGVPTELSAVVLVESGGLSTALSPKGARGVWQFMPDTARRYGLIVNGTRDDRLDLEKATWAAARYLKDLNHEFGNWSLALAAYNAGELMVRSALQRGKTLGFPAISDAGLLPLETLNYVPAVFAAMNRLNQGNGLFLNQNGTEKSGVIYATSE